jgi:hypothetical protein
MIDVLYGPLCLALRMGPGGGEFCGYIRWMWLQADTISMRRGIAAHLDPR